MAMTQVWAVVRECSRSKAAMTALSLLIVLSVRALNAAEHETVKLVGEQLRQRQRRIPSIKYSLSGTLTWKKGCVHPPPQFDAKGDIVNEPPNPASDLSAEMSAELTLDFRGNRHRLAYDVPAYSASLRTIYRIQVVEICDGVAVYSQILENSDPMLGIPGGKRKLDMLIKHGEIPAGSFTYRYLPLFFAHGSIALSSERVRPLHLTVDPMDTLGKVNAVSTADFDGHRCYVMQLPGSSGLPPEHVWFDAADYSVRRVVNGDDNPLSELRVEYSQGTAHPLASSWVWTVFEYPTENPAMIESIRVLSATEIPVSDEDFSAEVKPGMIVEDHPFEVRDGRLIDSPIVYRQEASGKTPMSPFVGMEPRAPRLLRRSFVSVCVLGAFIAIFFLCWQRLLKNR